MYNNILLVFAMENEANPLIKELNMQKEDFECQFCDIFKSNLGNALLTLVKPKKCPKFQVESVGTETASIITYIGIQRVRPDLVLNVGSSGGIWTQDCQLQTGQICVAKEEVYFYDRVMEIPFFKDYIDGKYPIQTNLHLQSEKLGFKQVQVGTTNSFTSNNKLKRQCGINVCEMESAAIGKVCYVSGVDFYILKSISDVEGCPHEKQDIVQQFDQNLDNISEVLAKKTKEFILLISK